MKLATGHFPTLLNHAKDYLLGLIARRALSLISVPVLTRMLLPEEYGVISIFMTYVGLLTILLPLNTNTAVAPYLYQKHSDFKQFLGTTIYVIFITTSFSSIVFILFKRSFSKLLGLPETLILWLLPFALTGIIFSLFRQICVAQRKSKTVAGINAFQAYAGFAIGVCLVLAMKDERYYGILFGYLSAGIIVSIISIKRLLPYIKMALRYDHVVYIIKYCIPYIPYVLSAPILNFFDLIIIKNYLGDYSVGIYNVAYSIGGLLSVVITALLTAWTPEFFSDMKAQNFKKIDKDVDKMFRLILIGAMFLMLFGQDIGVILADKKYHGGMGIIPVVVFGYIFTSLWQFWGRSIGYSLKSGWSSAIAIAAGLLNIVLNLIFIPRFGYIAGAYTTVTSFVFMALMGWVVSKWILRLHVTPMRIILKPLLVLLVIYYTSVFLKIIFDMEYLTSLSMQFLLFCGFILIIIWQYQIYIKRFGSSLFAQQMKGRGRFKT